MLPQSEVNRFLLPLLLAAMCLPLSGCIYSREIAHVRRSIEREIPGAEFDRQIVVSVGPGVLNTVGWIAGRVDDPDAQRVANYMEDIRRVKVGVYETQRFPLLESADLSALSQFRERGWELAAKVREDDEIVWVLYRERYSTIRDVFVLALTDEELVIVRMEGNLNRLVQKIVEDETYAAHLVH